jgi:PadR family transcriptional regulator PadR
MRKGALEYCVLGLLDAEPLYGFELVRKLGTFDGLLTSEGTIYPLLARLRNEGFVTTEWRESREGPPRKYYQLTTAGRDGLASFRQQWTAFRTAVDQVLSTGGL